MFETMRLGGVVGIGVPHMSICDSQIGKRFKIGFTGYQGIIIKKWKKTCKGPIR